MAAPPRKPIKIREVWSVNLEEEFKLIGSIVDEFPYISMDTEFPGAVVKQIDGMDYFSCTTPEQLYMLVKANVELMKLIQVGLTFTDSEGNLPDLGTENCYIWEINFRDFNVENDPGSPTSIKFLRDHGMNFDRNRSFGVNSVKFGELMMGSGMVCNGEVKWIVFQGTWDFGLFIKILTQKSLPDNLSDFLVLLKVYFSKEIYDIKCMIVHCNGLYGGLEKIGGQLQLQRDVGNAHQAGSDSLLTWRVFRRLWSWHFNGGGLGRYAGVMFRLND